MRDCGQCGRRAAPGERFCSSCGSHLEWHDVGSTVDESDADTLPLDRPRTAPPRVGLDVTPHQQVTERAASFAVRVSNPAGEPVDVALSAEDLGGGLRLLVEPQRLRVPAGGHAEAAVQAAVPGRAPHRPVRHDLTVLVVADADPHRGALVASADVALVHAVAAGDVGAPVGAPAPRAPDRRRRRWLVLLAVLVILAVAVGGGLLLAGRAGGVEAVVVGAGVNVRTEPSGSAPRASEPLGSGTRLEVDCLTSGFARIASPVEGFVTLRAIRLEGDAPAC